jgi:hypothetical protein
VKYHYENILEKLYLQTLHMWYGLDRDQWRVVFNKVMNLRVPENVGKFLSSCTTGGFSRRAQLYGVR